MHAAVLLVAAFGLGSTPFAYLAGRALRGIDLRQHGSGNLGATNVYRTLGAVPAVVVLLLDAVKGALPALLFPAWAGLAPAWGIAFGGLAIAGHVRPYGGLFRGGGKGVATAAGVFAALTPVACAIALVAFVAVVATTRYVSLGSMTAGAVLAATAVLRDGAASPVALAACAVAAFLVWTHRANIGRLRRGEEARLGRPGGAGGTR